MSESTAFDRDVQKKSKERPTFLIVAGVALAGMIANTATFFMVGRSMVSPFFILVFVCSTIVFAGIVANGFNKRFNKTPSGLVLGTLFALALIALFIFVSFVVIVNVHLLFGGRI